MEKRKKKKEKILENIEEKPLENFDYPLSEFDKEEAKIISRYIG